MPLLRLVHLGVSAAAVVPIALNAQVSTTNCQILGNQVRCNTQQGVMQVRGWGEDLGQNLGNFANAVINARRQAQARKAYTVALQEAESRARAQAELQQREMEAAAARARAEASIANDREQARQRLFAEKAVNVVFETAEGMRLQGKVQTMWVQAVSTTLQDLYKVRPEASRLEIYDAIAPKLMIVLRSRDDYMRKHVAHEPLFSRYQRLNLKATLGDSLAYERFWVPVTRAAEPLFMEWPDEINVERFAAVVEPVFASLEAPKTAPGPARTNPARSPASGTAPKPARPPQ